MAVTDFDYRVFGFPNVFFCFSRAYLHFDEITFAKYDMSIVPYVYDVCSIIYSGKNLAHWCALPKKKLPSGFRTFRQLKIRETGCNNRPKVGHQAGVFFFTIIF